MNTVRTEALNLLLCLALGVLVGALAGLTVPGQGKGSSQPSGLMAAQPQTLEQDAGVQAMQSIEDQHQRRFALFNNMTRLAVNDMSQALALLPEGDAHDAVLRDWITQRLVKTRPDLAVKAAAAMRDAGARAALIAPSLFGWHEQNAPQAAGWLRASMDEMLAGQMVKLSMSHEPAFAARVLFDLRGTPAYQRHFRDLMQRWVQLDNAEAFRFMEMLPGDAYASSMLEGVGSSLLSLPEEPTRAWLRRLPEAARATVIEDMVSMLPSTTTVAGAQRWMDEMAPLAGQSEAVAQWFSSLVRLTPMQAQDALDSMSDSPARELCIAGCVQALGVRDRASALDWTQELADDRQRLQMAKEQWLAWLQEDRTAASEWLTGEAAGEVFGRQQREQWQRLYHLKPKP